MQEGLPGSDGSAQPVDAMESSGLNFQEAVSSFHDPLSRKRAMAEREGEQEVG